ncbi:hypothetical protein SZ64_11595 [Erythrobacter sp. SG61-1L]|uniref:hypothetical protein n=1 Tax=Erythrobacter sp. SG61-1L TaxID=1603897 RepID=UPI0006C905B8|nr:hypothetical protein [Erythrobacter sp. SG61-1L]KPL68682.1 hypothetical protein SZ64_11595 [Erythrobacter sp. SG61-1L]
MNLRFIDWIWHIRGSLELPPEQSNDEAFERLAPLFDQNGTSHARTGDSLTFTKKDQAAQDKMSVFDSGVLKIENGATGPVLRYHLISRALLFCFLAPLLFLGFAQLAIAVNSLEKQATEAAEKSGKAKDAEKKPEKKDVALPQNPIDKALGAPAPEKPKKDDDKDKKEKKDKHSPTPAYVFAGIFAALYVGGRVLEDRLIRSLFRKKLQGA